MAKLSKKQATINGLLACGCVEVFGRSTKYRCFTMGAVTYLVGRGGGLRRTKSTIANSYSCTGSRIHAAYEYIGRIAPSCELSVGQFRHLCVEVMVNGVPA
jgi:hypothetical protein